MRAQLILISAAALLAACSNPGDAKPEGEAAASKAAEPVRMAAPQPGLWQQTISGGAIPAPMTVKMCVGPAVEGENAFTAPQTGATCSENTARTTASGAEFHSVCTTQGMTVTSDGKVTGDMRNSYKVDITTRTTGANVPAQMADMQMTIDATRLGDCPAGAEPNSVVP
jgi:hypothetical protein